MSHTKFNSVISLETLISHKCVLISTDQVSKIEIGFNVKAPPLVANCQTIINFSRLTLKPFLVEGVLLGEKLREWANDCT